MHMWKTCIQFNNFVPKKVVPPVFTILAVGPKLSPSSVLAQLLNNKDTPVLYDDNNQNKYLVGTII